MFRWLCIGVLAAVVLGVGSASAQAQNRLLLENSQLDFVVASESAGYACTVEVDSVTLHSRLIVRKVALPSGVLGPAIVVHERVAFDATPPILSCSLVISADEATAVVAFAQALPGTGRELYRAVVNLATGTSDVAEITTAFVAGFDVRIKARRSGDAYYIGFSTSTNSFWVVYFANLAALGTGPGAVTPTSTELVLSSTGWSPVVPTSADMDAAVLGGAPGMVVTIGLFTGGTATSDGMREWSMVNGVKVDAFTGLRRSPTPTTAWRQTRARCSRRATSTAAAAATTSRSCPTPRPRTRSDRGCCAWTTAPVLTPCASRTPPARRSPAAWTGSSRGATRRRTSSTSCAAPPPASASPTRHSTTTRSRSTRRSADPPKSSNPSDQRPGGATRTTSSKSRCSHPDASPSRTSRARISRSNAR